MGESGSGKSVAAMSILHLLEGAAHPNGSIHFDGRELLNIPESQIRPLRGGDVAMIFQEPLTSLNPVMKVGAQIEEAIRAHQNLPRHEARERAAALLADVGIPRSRPQAQRVSPPVPSSGMRQRAMIAMALACRPIGHARSGLDTRSYPGWVPAAHLTQPLAELSRAEGHLGRPYVVDAMISTLRY